MSDATSSLPFFSRPLQLIAKVVNRGRMLIFDGNSALNLFSCMPSGAWETKWIVAVRHSAKMNETFHFFVGAPTITFALTSPFSID